MVGVPHGIHAMVGEKAMLTCHIALKTVFNCLSWIPIRSYSHLSPHQWPSSPSMTISSNLLHHASSFNILCQMTTTNLQPPPSPSTMMTNPHQIVLRPMMIRLPSILGTQSDLLCKFFLPQVWSIPSQFSYFSYGDGNGAQYSNAYGN